jgi:hypothetical protein
MYGRGVGRAHELVEGGLRDGFQLLLCDSKLAFRYKGRHSACIRKEHISRSHIV